MATPPYVDQSQLELRFSAERVAQLFSVQAADGSDSGAVDTATLNAIIVDASAEFDSLIGVEFPMPLVQVSGAWDPVLVEIVCIFVMFRGASRRPEYGGNDQKKLNPYEKEYQLALKRCVEIKEGKRRLAGNTPRPANQGGEVLNTNPDGITPYWYFWPDPYTGEGGGGF